MEGRNDTLSLIISLETKMESFRNNLLDAILTSPPAELLGLNAEEIEAEFNVYFDQIDEEIPSAVELDETLLETDVMQQIESIREYVIHFNLAFIVLIAFSLLLILLTVLTYFSVRGSTRQLGIIFLVTGAISLAGAFITRSVINSQLVSGELPATLQTWVPEIITDTLTTLGIYAIGLLAVGIALTIVSFVYKRGGDEYDFYH